MKKIEENQYLEGFNAGYIIETKSEKIFEDIDKYEFTNPYMEGARDGRIQAKLDTNSEGRSQLHEREV